MTNEMRAFMERRDAAFRNPTLETARGLLPETIVVGRVDSPLAALHKARLQWLEATDAMLVESKKWLEDHGYMPSWRGAPPMTPLQRDVDRMRLGKPPLRGK
jgi:hypothetical protein